LCYDERVAVEKSCFDDQSKQLFSFLDFFLERSDPQGQFGNGVKK
jgi:hypothetical protein